MKSTTGFRNTASLFQHIVAYLGTPSLTGGLVAPHRNQTWIQSSGITDKILF
jgi:hypothetical protein